MAQSIESKVMPLKVHKYPDASLDQKGSATYQSRSGPPEHGARLDTAIADVTEHDSYAFREAGVGVRNANDGMFKSQVAEDRLKQIDHLLGRMREVAERSGSGAFSGADRPKMGAQFDAMNAEISEVLSTAMFNGEPLLDSNGWAINYQLNPNAGAEELEPEALRIQPLEANINTTEASLASLDKIDALSETVSSSRAQLLGMQHQFEHAISQLQSGTGNQSTTHMNIKTTDHAMESAMVTRSQVLQQGDTAMSAQANVLPRNVSYLLG